MYIENSSTPVMGVTLSVASEQAKSALMDSLNQLVQTDKQLTYYQEPHHYTVEITLGGAGEVHLNRALTQLKALCPVPIQTSSLFTCFRETIVGDNRNDLRRVTSPNRKNLIYGYAEGILSSVCDLKREVLSPLTLEGLNPLTPDVSVVDMRRLNANEVRNTWDAFPESNPTNFLINSTQNVPHMNEIKSSCQLGFREACLRGALVGEPLTGIKIVLANAQLGETPRERLGTQIVVPIRSLVHGLQMRCGPILVEPFYNIKIRSSPTDRPALLSLMNLRRGHELENSEFVIPVEASYGLSEELQALTHNRAKAEVTFSHWSILHENPLDPATNAAQIVQSIRTRKRMSERVKSVDDYISKL